MLNTLLGVIFNFEVDLFLSSTDVPPVFSIEDTMESTADLVSVLMELTFQWKRLTDKQTNTQVKLFQSAVNAMKEISKGYDGEKMEGPLWTR